MASVSNNLPLHGFNGARPRAAVSTDSSIYFGMTARDAEQGDRVQLHTEEVSAAAQSKPFWRKPLVLLATAVAVATGVYFYGKNALRHLAEKGFSKLAEAIPLSRLTESFSQGSLADSLKGMGLGNITQPEHLKQTLLQLVQSDEGIELVKKHVLSFAEPYLGPLAGILESQLTAENIRQFIQKAI